MDKKLNGKNFIAIADWMISDFDFSTRELLCYAIIYGFSQDGESVFSGSLSYLSQWLGIRRDNVLRYLNSLVEKGAVTKEKKQSATKTWCEYKAIIDKGAARNSDHIIISPWMIEELSLQDKELIEYALIYGFSRSGSNSYFSGNNAYIAKWLGIDKSNVKRYTSSLIKKGVIKKIEESNQIKYIALRPNSNNSGYGQFEYTQVINEKNAHGQNEYTPSQSEYSAGQDEYSSVVNLSTNNLNKPNNNLLDIVVDDKYKNDLFDVVGFIDKTSKQTERILEAYRYSKEGYTEIKKTLDLICEVVNCYGEEKTDIINNLNEKQCLTIFKEANLLAGDSQDKSIKNKKAKLSSTIGKMISKNKAKKGL